MKKNNMNKQQLHGAINKYVDDKVPNVTTGDMNKKSLSGFMHTEKWHTL